MTKLQKIFLKLLITFIFVFVSNIFVTSTVLACCSDSECNGGNGQCIDAPANNCGVQGYGSGYCVSGLETCNGSTGSSACTGGECCGSNNLCTLSCGGGGGGGGGGNPIACRPVAVNCPIGSTVDYTQEVSSSCWNIHDQGSACSIGNAQLAGNTSSTGTWCCYGANFQGDNCWVTPGGVTRCDSYYECRNVAIKTYRCVVTTPTCTVDILPQTVAAGSSVLFPASIPTSSGVITQVNFGSSNPAVATVTTPDTVASYSSTATGVGAGTTTITASVVMSGSIRCTDTAILTVTNVPSWWQVRDGDVTANGGDISSRVPAGQLFNTNGLGGFPGVPVYSGALNVGSGVISSTNWNADTVTTQGRIFDYSYFENLIPDDIIPTTNSTLLTSTGFVGDGYEWFKITGDLNVNTINFANRKVILFVDGGDLNISGNINVTDGTGFFGAFVNGDINVNSTITGVPSLEGVYLSDNQIATNT